MSFQLTRSYRCLPFLLLLFLFLAPALRADVGITATFGFGRVSSAEQWTPVRVVLTNTGGRDVQGRLSLSYPQSNLRGAASTSAEVDLPSNSTKAYTLFTLPPYYFSRCDVTLREGSSVVAKTTARNAVGGGERDSILLASIGDQQGAPTFLNGDTIKSKTATRFGPPGTPISIVVGAVSPDELLDRPAGYRGVDVLIITPASVSRATAEQLQALAVYAVSGGTLVISAGPDYRALRNPFFDDILPVRVTGAGSVTGFGAIADGGNYAQLPEPANVAVTQANPGAGKVIRSSEGIPLLVERAYGRGRVVFLAFDCTSRPFTQWDGQRAFWKSVIEQGRRRPMINGLTIDQGVYGYPGRPTGPSADLGSVVAGEPSVKPPSFRTMALFLLSYIIVLVPVNYVILSRHKRLELAWITTPAVVILFALVAWLIGFSSKGSSTEMNTATVYETGAGCSYARAYTIGWTFSPARRSRKVVFKDRATLPRVFVSSAERDFVDVVAADESYADNVDMAMWSSTVFESDSGIDMGGRWDVDLASDGVVLAGTVKNGTKVDVSDCVLAWGTSIARIGSVRPGQTVRVSLAVGSSNYVRRPPEQNWKDMKIDSRLSAGLLNFARQGKRPPCLIGLVPAVNTIDVEGMSGKRQSAACIVMPLEYRLGSTGLVTAKRIRWELDKSRSKGVISIASDATTLKARVERDGIADVSGVIDIPADLKVSVLAIEAQMQPDVRPGPHGMPPGGIPGSPGPPGPPPGASEPASGFKVTIYDYDEKVWIGLESDEMQVLSRPLRFLGSGNRIRLRLNSASSGIPVEASVRVTVGGERSQPR